MPLIIIMKQSDQGDARLGGGHTDRGTEVGVNKARLKSTRLEPGSSSRLFLQGQEDRSRNAPSVKRYISCNDAVEAYGHVIRFGLS